MAITPKSLIEAVRYFSDLRTCNDYMRSIKWPDGQADSAEEKVNSVFHRFNGSGESSKSVPKEFVLDKIELLIERHAPQVRLCLAPLGVVFADTTPIPSFGWQQPHEHAHRVLDARHVREGMQQF